MKHTLSVFSAQGDTALAEWEVEDVEAVERAKGVFDEAIAQGFGAVAATPGGAKPLEQFTPEVENTFLLRPIAGG